MNSRALRLACTCAAALALAACATSDGGGYGGMSREETIGTAGGAVAGGLAGYAISGGAVGALIGAAAGGLIGNRLGNWLEGDGDQAAAQAAARAAESGQRVTWQKTGTTFETTQKGWATPAGSAYTAGDGRTCRPIRQSATQGEETREDTVTLCKGASGWAPA
jgi:surface antigen